MEKKGKPPEGKNGGGRTSHPETNSVLKRILSALRPALTKACNLDPNRITAWATVGLTILTAIIAICTLTSGEQSTRRSERAYLYVAPNNAYNVKADGAPLQGYILIGNSGKTFGTILDWQFGVNISEPDDPERIESLGRLVREPGNPAIWPGLPHSAYRTLRPLNTNEYQLIRTAKGENRIYVFGFLKYKDVFGDTHVTKFCHMYFGPEMADNSLSSYLRSQVKYCEKHNEAD